MGSQLVSEQNKKKYVPINKGHFDLDTPERTTDFSQKLALGWEEEYQEYRRLWGKLPKEQKVREYPLLVDLELSSICNLQCPMCYTITDDFKKKVIKGLMDFELYKKVVDEVAGKVFALRLSLRGEPTLHPNFVEAIAYAKKKGVKEVSSLTNCSKLTLDYFIKIADAGIDWLSISIDGLYEEYNKIRKPLKFKDTLSKLQAIQNYKEKNGLSKPVIKIQGIWPAIRPNPTQYYETLALVSDLLAYNPLIDYLRKDSEIVYEDNFSCPQLYQRIVVGSDGKVLLCSNDEDGEVILGDANQQTIKQIWHGNKMSEIRQLHREKDGFKSLYVCRVCYYPRKAVPNETATVCGRELFIENYVNRKQAVGN